MWTWYCHQAFAVISSLVCSVCPMIIRSRNREKPLRSEINPRRSSEASLEALMTLQSYLNKDAADLWAQSNTCGRCRSTELLTFYFSRIRSVQRDPWWFIMCVCVINLLYCQQISSLHRRWVPLSFMTNSSSRHSGSRRSSVTITWEKLKKTGWRRALSQSESRRSHTVWSTKAIIHVEVIFFLI